jgi:hypothetical protein
MKAKLFEVIVHAKVDEEEDDKKMVIPNTLHDDKHWAADEMAAGMKAMDIINKGKPDDQRISPDDVVVLVRPF